MPTFHHNFESLASESLLRRINDIRAHKALIPMLRNGLNVSTAAGLPFKGAPPGSVVN